MKYKLLISKVSVYETSNAYDYYEAQSTRLGERFLASVKEAQNKLAKTPYNYDFINDRNDFRDISLKSFPFVIIYQIIDNNVLVLRVFNTNRNPLSV